MPCDPNILLADAECFTCLSDSQLEAIKGYLTCQWQEATSGNLRITDLADIRITSSGDQRIWT